MAAPAVVAAIILLILALILILSYTAWLNSSNEACMNNLNEILTFTISIRDDPDNADVWCSGLKTAIIAFNEQCPDFSAPTYSSYAPLCE